MSNTLLEMVKEVKESLFGEDYDTSAGTKFNFAILKKTENGLIHEELWILANAYYDYDLDKFIKQDITHTSFGIQIQARGTYPGEAELGYGNNTGINFWRCPLWKQNASDTSYSVFRDTNYYDYNDMEENNWIGAQYDNSAFWGEKNGTWRTFGVATGWNNNFMTDSYGGITVGGAGFEIDGNGIFPFTRLTSSIYTDENNNAYYLLGILDNAYHPDQWSIWKCDSNEYGAWFYGLKYPQVNGVKDTENAKFVIMYNDMASINPTSNGYTIEDMDLSDWTTIFEVSDEGIKSLVNGVLTTLGTGGSGGSNVSLSDSITDGDTTHAVTPNAVHDALALKQDSSSAFSGNYNDLTNKPSIPTKISDLTDDSDFIEKSATNGLVKNDGTIDTNNYLTQHQDISGKIDTAGTGLTKNGTTLSADIGGNSSTSASKLVACNDSRLSDARTPTSHNQDLSTINNTSTLAVTITYTDDSTETKNLVVYTPPS